MHVRWESPSRYYEAVLQRDLLGDWVLSTANGGLRNRLGALRHLGFAIKGRGGQGAGQPAQAAPEAGVPFGGKQGFANRGRHPVRGGQG